MKRFKKNPIERVNNIIKAVPDKNQYRGLVLQNELKVLLISDNESELSAASLSIQVGQMSDPKYVSGLVHLMEHAISVASAKYPEDNSYQSFLTKNGGRSNAYAYASMTRFYFEIVPEKFEEALDRFSQHFISPLFPEAAVAREIKVINTEFEKNLYDDQWRIRQLNKHLADPKHPFKGFGTGNSMTLETIPKKMGINVRDELMDFFKKYFSANLMCLVVLGKESLDKLEEWVVSKFSEIENKKVEHMVWTSPPYLPEEYGTKVYVTPIKDYRSLVISFTTDDFTRHFRARPEEYVTRLIEHQGKGSIFSQLRERHWSNKICANHLKVPYSFGLLEISINLTEDGLEHVDEIIQLVFEYMTMLRNEGPKKWLFDEMTNIQDLDFRHGERQNARAFVIHLVHAMQLYPMEELITGPALNIEWRPELLKDLINALRPSQCRIFLVAKKYEPTTYEVEPIYKTKFRKEILPQPLLQQWEKSRANNVFHLPPPNPYIPTDFTIFPKEMPAHPTPVIIFDSPCLRTWYKQNFEVKTPKTYMHIEFSNPIVADDEIFSNLMHMFVAIFLDSVYEILFYINLAGLQFSMAPSLTGIKVIFAGYSHKLSILLKSIITKLFEFKVDQKVFEIFKEERIRQLKNALTEQSYKHALSCVHFLITQKCYPNASYGDVMKDTTLKDLDHFLKDFFHRLNIECFIYGNANKQNALALSDFLKDKLEKTYSIKSPLLMLQLLPPRDYKLKEGESYSFDYHTKYSKLCCTLLYLQCGPRKENDVVIIGLLVRIMELPCLEFLQTKDLIGYNAKCDTWITRNSNGMYIAVQTDKEPHFIEERIEKFLLFMMDVLTNMTDDSFQRYKKSFQVYFAPTPRTSLQRFQVLLEEISSELYNFNKLEIAKNILNSLTKKNVIDFFTTYISKNAPSRRALFIYISTPYIKMKKRRKDQPEVYADLFSYHSFKDDLSDYAHTKILDPDAFKASLEMYPLTKPYQNIQFKGRRVRLNYS